MPAHAVVSVIDIRFTNEGKDNSEPPNPTIVLSFEKKGQPAKKSNDVDSPRFVVHFPNVDWNEELERGARGFEQRKARRSLRRMRKALKMTPALRTEKITTAFTWLQNVENQDKILAIYDMCKVFKDNLDFLLKQRAQEQSWMERIVITDLFAPCLGYPSSTLPKRLQAFRAVDRGKLRYDEKVWLYVLYDLLQWNGVVFPIRTLDSSGSQNSSGSEPSTDENGAEDEQSSSS